MHLYSAAVLTELRTFMASEFAKAAGHNRANNAVKFDARAQAAISLMAGLGVCIILVLFTMILRSGFEYRTQVLGGAHAVGLPAFADGGRKSVTGPADKPDGDATAAAAAQSST